MIITRTPFRVSLCGGGSDLASYWRAGDPGYVVSAAINRYMYITVAPKYDGQVRVSYSITENVKHARDVAHPLVRAALQLANVRGGVEIVSVADIPAGTGLGSSSAFTVGLLHALYASQGEFASADRLAHDACRVEIEYAHSPIGKQDQYAAAFGGLRGYTFLPDGGVSVEQIAAHQETIQALQDHLLLLDTGIRRDANVVLADQTEAMRDSRKRAGVRALVNLAHTFRDALICGELRECGAILDSAWRLKRNVARGVASVPIDGWYAQALAAGAWGGKVCGAGGGGFMLMLAPPDTHTAIARATGLRAVPIRFDWCGSQVVYCG